MSNSNYSQLKLYGELCKLSHRRQLKGKTVVIENEKPILIPDYGMVTPKVITYR